MGDRDSRKQKKLNRISKRVNTPTSNKKKATRDLRRAEAIENDKSLSSETRSGAGSLADIASTRAFAIEPGNNSFNQDTSRQGKKLNRIEKRSEKGFKNYKQAGRNLDRAVKIEEHYQNKDMRNAAGRAGDIADKVFNQFEDLSPFQKTGPFYKTGDINYNK